MSIPAVVGAHHVSLAVADVERSREFYGGLLGLPEIERPDFGLPGAWYQAGPVQLHLIQTPEGFDVGRNAAKLTPLAAHVAFEIEDYARVLTGLQARGQEIVPTREDVGQMFTRDPDGNVVELIVPGGRLGRQADG